MINPYELQFSDSALKSLKSLSKTVASRILSKLERLAQNADDLPHQALTGQWSGYFRTRIGDYRVIYDLDRDQQILYVERIGHRRDIYGGGD